MLALCFMLSSPYYAENYAGIIDTSQFLTFYHSDQSLLPLLNSYFLFFMVYVWCKILTGENIDEFDEFPTIRQYFPYQNFTFSHLPLMNLCQSGAKYNYIIASPY